MAPPFPFEPLLIFGFLSLMLLFGLLLRTLVPFFQKYVTPVLAIALTGGMLTTLLVWMLGRQLSEYPLERTVAIYGVVTGTVSCGLLLLRIVDPEFKTPVARELGFMNIFAVPVVGGLTALLNAPFWWDWSAFVTALVFAGILFAVMVLLLNRKLWHNL